jgi:hypothetical protein
MATAAISCEKQLKIGFIFSRSLSAPKLNRSPGTDYMAKNVPSMIDEEEPQKLVLQSDTQSSHCRINMVKIM